MAKDSAPYFRKAKKFYDGLAHEMVTHGHIMDIFVCALDQVCVVCVCGLCVLCELCVEGGKAAARW